MKTTVNRDVLIKKLKENRDNHHAIFLEAVNGYRQKAIEELNSRLDAVMNTDKPVAIYFSLRLPEDHTKEYDRIIGMLQMTNEKQITLSEQEYANFVDDDWEWRHSFLVSNSYYSATAAKLSSEEE